MHSYQIDFINKLAPYAVADWNDNHIVLPSVTLAQGLRESAWGRSKLAINANNLFGIKCGTNWNGRSYIASTKEYYNGNTSATTIKDAFRSYNNWGQGVRDHSLFLSKKRYSIAKGETNFTIACNYIKKCGYATGPYYSSHLVNDIINYKLYLYDTIQPNFDEIIRVQVGAYNNQDNAIDIANKLVSKGFNYCIIYDDITHLFYVQVGAYRNKVMASNIFSNLLLKGFSPIMKIKK